MIIAGENYPSIGFIRVKPVGERHLLSIFPPPDSGLLAGSDGASHIEVEVSEEELCRIERVAPHLLGTAPWQRKVGAGSNV